jgi:hypothetical protein
MANVASGKVDTFVHDAVGTLAVGFQRLLGHDFDSRRQPQAMDRYCQSRPGTWIYDEGRREFVYCTPKGAG